MLLSSLMYLILACFLGAVLGCFFESLVFFVVFQFLRRYAGGYHAATEARCEILSALSIFACLIGIRLSKIYDFQTVLLFLSLASAVFICIFCPLDTPEKPLSKKERCYFRKITWLISALHVAAALAAFFLSWSFLFAPCCFSLILEGILLLAGEFSVLFFDKTFFCKSFILPVPFASPPAWFQARVWKGDSRTPTATACKAK